MSAPPRINVPNALFASTYKVLGGYGSRRVEAGCLWYGIRTAEASIAIALGVPWQKNDHGSFEIPGEALAQLTTKFSAFDLVVVAQIHTHPGTNVCHSPWDDIHMVSERVYSFVLPKYGKGTPSLEGVGVHRFDGNRWSLLTEDRMNDCVTIYPTMVDMR